MTYDDINEFQEKIAELFISHLKGNILSRFASAGDIITALSIFDLLKVPDEYSSDRSHYGEVFVSALLAHYGVDKSAETMQGDETTKAALISPDIKTEWKTFRRYMAKQNSSLKN